MSDKSYSASIHDIRETAKIYVQDTADYLVATSRLIGTTAEVYGEFDQDIDLGFDDSRREWLRLAGDFERQLKNAADRLEDYVQALRRCADDYEETIDENIRGIDNIFKQEKAENEDTG